MSEIISTVLVGMLLILWIHMLWKRRKYYAICLKVPGPLGYPIIGMAHALINREEILFNFEKLEGIHGSLFYSWLGPKPVLVVSEPQFAQDVLTSQDCVNKGFMYEAINDATGRGLFGLNEPEWSRHRKLLNPAFSYKSLAGLMAIFNEETGKLLTILDMECGKGEINVMRKLQKFSLSLAAKTTMGKETITESSGIELLLDSYKRLLETMTKMSFSPWLRLRLFRWMFGLQESYFRAKTHIRLFITRSIQKKMKILLDISSKTPTVGDEKFSLNLALDLMKKGSFTYENVEDEMNVIVFGAFETTANTISYTLMLLAMFPCHQQKLFEEIKSFYADTGDFEVEMSEIQQFVFLDMIINETMRLMAPVPLVAREVSKDVKLSNGIVIPAGVQIAIDIFNMHRRQDIWGQDAHKFNPENFLPTNLEGKHSYAFIPFTKGIRNCIGSRYAMLSVKVALIKLIRNYEFRTNFNFNDLYFIEDITLKLRKTPLLELRQRNS